MNKGKGESFKSLRLKHFDLLTEVDEAKDHPASLIPNIKEQIEEWRQAGGYISKAGERDYLRSILSFWGSFVFEHSEPKEYPETDLYPLDIKIAQRAKMRRMLKRVVWSVMCVVGLAGILAFLFGEGIFEAIIGGPTATPTVPSPTTAIIVAVSPTSTSTDVCTPTLVPTPTNTQTNTPVSINTPTPTDTPTPMPTEEPTEEPTAEPTEEPTEEPIPTPDAVVNVEALNLRSGPGVVYDILGVLKRGDYLKVIGRNPAGNWLKVTCPSGQGGWVARWLLQVNVDMDDVPVGTEIPPTPTPTPIYAPTPTATPAPALLPPPILIEPENGAAFIGGPVILKWQWDKPLAQDELFALRVRREGETEPCHHSQVQGLEYWGDLTYCSAGKHFWEVALLRQLCKDCPGEEMWQELSEPSEERWIYYVPGKEPWTWPTPDSGGEPGAGPSPGDEDGDGDGGGPCPGCRP